MSVLCLTGWQQPSDALDGIAPGATHFDYGRYADCEQLFSALPKSPDLAIGWSLGGLLLARAVAAGHTKPGKLILIAAPFQWVADSRFPQGIAAELAADAAERYAREPRAMLANLNALIALGDAREKTIVRALNQRLSVWKNGSYWLEMLGKASCADLDFSDFPPTAILHGAADRVIVPENALAFERRIPGARRRLLPECAHAPHLHDADNVRDWIRTCLT